jgi:hypothetical protein
MVTDLRTLEVGDIYYTVIVRLRYTEGHGAFGLEPTPEAALACVPDDWPTRPLYIEERLVEQTRDREVYPDLVSRCVTSRTLRRWSP